MRISREMFNKLVIYGNGKILLSKETDPIDLHDYNAETGKISNCADKMLYFNLAGDVKTARKENLNRRDNYFLKYTPEYCSWEKRTALYVHVSEIEVEELEEFVHTSFNGETNYKQGYKLHFANGFRYDHIHRERLNVPKDWKLPAGATWDRGRNHYSVIDEEEQRLRKEYIEAAGKEYVPYNLVHVWYTEETGYDMYTYCDGYSRTEKDADRLERERIAEAINQANGGSNRISHYDIERWLKVVDIRIKEEAHS